MEEPCCSKACGTHREDKVILCPTNPTIGETLHKECTFMGIPHRQYGLKNNLNVDNSCAWLNDTEFVDDDSRRREIRTSAPAQLPLWHKLAMAENEASLSIDQALDGTF